MARNDRDSRRQAVLQSGVRDPRGNPGEVAQASSRPRQRTTAARNAEARRSAICIAASWTRRGSRRWQLKPLQREFAAIDAIKDKSELRGADRASDAIGVTTPGGLEIDQDKPTRPRTSPTSAGRARPAGPRLLPQGCRRALVGIRKKYGEHIEKMLTMAGDKTRSRTPRRSWRSKPRWPSAWNKVEKRDPVKTYNKVAIDKLAGLAPGFDWKAWLDGTGVAGKVTDRRRRPAELSQGVRELVEKTPLPVWKAYLRWNVLSDSARFLSKAFVDENFAFYGTTLTGTPENRPRWKRGVAVVNGSIGEALGKVYVEKYFPPRARRAWKSSSRICWPRTGRASTSSTGWARDQEGGARQARQVHAEDRLSGQVARLLEARRSRPTISSAT